VIQKWYCIRLSHINFIQEKTSLVWTLSSFERGIFYAYFSAVWYCEFCCADFTNFYFLKSFFKKRLTFTASRSLQVRGILFGRFHKLKKFIKNRRFWVAFLPLPFPYKWGVFFVNFHKLANFWKIFWKMGGEKCSFCPYK